MAKRAVHIIAGILLALALLFPPFRFVWVSGPNTYTGLLGYRFVTNAPDNPIALVRVARVVLSTNMPFNHMQDTIRAEIDALRLVLEIIAIVGLAALLIAFLDRRSRRTV